MKQYKGFLIDLDGTVYRGTEKITEAVQFVNELKRLGLPYLFVTNNSTKHPNLVAESLREMGVHATVDDVFTTGMATATHISSKKKEARIFMIGEEGLEVALKEEGHQLVDESPDYVVMGLDRQIDYEKLTKAATFVRNGATFIATNGDVALPTEKGFLPGNGSIVSVISVTTGVEPIFIGKPESIIIDQALAKIGTAKEETVMIGDNYFTDILAGINAGLDTMIVYTGVSTRDEVKTYDHKPTHEINSLDEWTLS